MQQSILSASYNHFWRCAHRVFAAFLWWVLLWGSYLKGASSVFSLFMVSSIWSVYPNIEDVNPIASRMFAAVLMRPLDGQYYCSILYCAACFSLDGSIMCAVFHIARGSDRVNRLGHIYPACVVAALTLCLKRNKAGYEGRAKYCWRVRVTVVATETEQWIQCFILELNTSLLTIECTESVANEMQQWILFCTDIELHISMSAK